MTSLTLPVKASRVAFGWRGDFGDQRGRRTALPGIVAMILREVIADRALKARAVFRRLRQFIAEAGVGKHFADQILLGIEMRIKRTVGQARIRHDAGQTDRGDALLAKLLRRHSMMRWRVKSCVPFRNASAVPQAGAATGNSRLASKQFREQGVAAVVLAGIMSGCGPDQRCVLCAFRFQGGSGPRSAFPRRLSAINCRRRRNTARALRARSAITSRKIIATIPAGLSDVRAGRRNRPPSEGDPRCLHRQGQRCHRTDRGWPRAGQRHRSAAKGGRDLRLMVGALQLARAVNDKRLSGEILQSGADEAIALAGQIGK